MKKTGIRIIDGDGHLHEDAMAISHLLPSPYKEMRHLDRPNFPYKNLFPPVDHLHTPFRESPATRSERPRLDPPGWMKFLDDVGIDTTVLYASSALASGRITFVDEAIAVCHAYNDWLYKSYMAASPRFKTMAILPMQDPQEAAKELRRVVKLGMPGAMLPSTGLKSPLGAREFWPVYEVANELGCALGLHGAGHSGIGLDQMNQFAAVHALGHPVGITINFASIYSNGLFDRFPNLKWGFLEGGIGWMFMALERLTASNKSFEQPNPRGHLVKIPKGKTAAEHIKKHMAEGRIYIGCEGDEIDIAYAVKAWGSKPFLFSSDFPHEVTNETCKEEIHELLENKDISQEAKADILQKNAERFYGFKLK